MSFGFSVNPVGIKISTQLNFWRLLLAAQQMDNFLLLMIQANLVLSWASYKRSWQRSRQTLPLSGYELGAQWKIPNRMYQNDS